MNILEREKGLPAKPDVQGQQQKQQQSPECVETKLIIWQEDQFEDFEVDYLNQVFPQKINKNTISKGCEFIFHFLAGSLNYWVEIKDPEVVEENKLSSKDWKFIQTSLQQDSCDNAINYNRWGKYFRQKQQFDKKELEQQSFKIPTGQKVHQYDRGSDHYVVYKYLGNNKQFMSYKQRFEILFLFYIDGVSFVNEEIPEWEYYVIFKQKKQGEKHSFVGVLSKYIFKLTSVKQRHRISQVFVMPSYQKHGHGSQLLDLVYGISLSQNSCFQITTEIPSFQYQCLRDYKELKLILERNLFEPERIPKITSKEDVQIALEDNLISKQTLRKIKEQIKLPGNQIERLATILISAKINSQEENQMSQAHFEQYLRQRIIFNRSAFKSRKKVPHITFQNETPDMKEFFLEKTKQDFMRNQSEIQQILTQTLDGYRRVIAKLNKNGLVKFT